jgi:hypothetical protein
LLLLASREQRQAQGRMHKQGFDFHHCSNRSPQRKNRLSSVADGRNAEIDERKWRKT